MKWFLVCLVSLAVVFGQEKPPKDPALDLYFNANGLFNRKLYPIAAKQFEQFLAQYKGHEKTKNVELGLAMSYMAIGEAANAEPHLARLAADGNAPNRDHVLLLRGQSLMQQGKLEEAGNAYFEGTRLAKRDTYKEKCRLGLTEVLYQQKKWPELERELGRLTSDLTTRARYQLAAAQQAQGRPGDAAKGLQSLLNIDAKDPLAQHLVFLLGECERAAGNLDGASKAYKRASADLSGPFSVQASYLLGVTQLDLGQTDAAIQVLSRLVKEQKDDPLVAQASVALGRAFYAKNDLPRVEKTLKPFLDDAEAGTEAALWLGRAFMQADKPKDAVPVLKAAVERGGESPLMPGLLFDLARAQVSLPDLSSAAESYGTFATRFPDHAAVPDARFQQASILHQAKQYEQSTLVCDRFLQQLGTHSNAAEVAFIRAENFYLGAQPEQAIRSFQTFSKTYPTSPRIPFATFRLGQIFFDQQQWSEALENLEPLRANTALPQAAYLAAATAYRAELWDKAVLYLGEFVASQPKADQADLAQLTLGLAEQRRDKPEAAMTALQTFVASYPKSAHIAQGQLELGKLQNQAEAFPDALKSLSQVDAASSFHPEALYYIGFANLGQNQTPAAVKAFAALAERYKEHRLASDARLQQGLALLNSEGFAEAQTAFTSFLKAYPQDPRAAQASYGLGLALARQESWQAAAEQLSKVASDSEFRPRALYEKAWAEKGLGQTNAAIATYTELVSTFAEHAVFAVSSFELAELEYEAGKFEQAAKRLSPLLNVVNDRDVRDRILFRLGWCYTDLDKPLDASKAFEVLLSESPDSSMLARTAFQAGEARFTLNEYTPARGHFETCIAAKPDGSLKPQALLRLSEAQALTEQYDASETTCRTFLNEFPAHVLLPRAQLGLGWALENQNKKAEAIAAYQQVLLAGAKTETAARAQFQIGECHFALAAYEDAIIAFNAVEVNYGFPAWQSKALLEMGRALAKLGDRTGANARFSEVLKTYPESKAAIVAKDELRRP